MVKVIFLDIDGVLNCEVDYTPNEELDAKLYFHSKRCVANLNKLTDETGAKIVVSSTWRLSNTDVEMEETLRKIGVTGEYLGMTPDLRGYGCLRGNEIYKWIKDNEDTLGCHHYDFRSYIILDDDSDMLLWQKNNYVNVDPFCGLTERSVYKATAILNKAPCPDVGQEFV